MQGLLALAWLSPKDPNILDKTFGSLSDGKWVDFRQTFANQLDIALLMLGVMVVFWAWRVFRHRVDLNAVAPELDAKLRDPRVVTWADRLVTAALVVVALFASVNYFYGTRNDGIYVHRWDAFHTVIGVKYHSELGYFDLYKCAYAIDQAGPRHFRGVRDIRDLRTRKFEGAEQHIAGNDCKERFTPERLEEFQHDLDEFGQWSSRSQWKKLFHDKGFNGTPFYATVCKLLIGSVDVTLDGMKSLAKIDPFLMMFAFGVVGWAFGVRQAALAAIFFCVFFPNRYTHMGGSILRFDYIATLLIGFSALKKDKWGLAGAMFAYATMVRVFPAIFAVGVGIKLAADVVVERKLRPEHWRFAAFALGGLLLFFLISLVGMRGGFENWQTWAENMRIHNERSASFRVGFKHLFMIDGDLESNDFGLKQRNFVDRQLYYWVAVIVLMTPLLLAVRRLDTVSFGALFGVFGFFLLAIATRYYYGVVALLFLIDREPLKNRFMLLIGAMLFAATAFDFFFFALNDSDSLMYNNILGAELAVVVFVIGSFLLFNPSLLDLPMDPRLPAHVPAQLGVTAAPVEPPSTVVVQERRRRPTNNDDPHDAVTINDGPRVPPDEGEGEASAPEAEASAPEAEAEAAPEDPEAESAPEDPEPEAAPEDPEPDAEPSEAKPD